MGFISYERTVSDVSYPKKTFSKNTRDFCTGFTLVELIVSMALFIIVILIVTGAFLNLVQLHKSARSTMTALDSVSVAIENMVRNIRIGDTYRCGTFYGSFYPNRDLPSPPGTGSYYPMLTPQDCPGGAEQIVFYVSEDNASEGVTLVGYKYNPSTPTNPGSINGRGNICCSYLTSPENVNITKLTFYVTGTQGGSTEQPRVRIVLQGETTATPVSKFSIYTSVTQRSPK